MNSRDASLTMASIISGLPGSAKASLAGYLNVSLREVERWSASANQSRNYIPNRYWNTPPDRLPPDLKQRFNVSELLFNGFAAHIAGGGKTGTYLAGTGSLATALALADRYRRGEMNDPFKDNTTVGIQIVPATGGRWSVSIDYEVVYSDGAFGDRDWEDDFQEDAEDDWDGDYDPDDYGDDF